MASIKDRQGIDMNRLEPVETPAQAPVVVSPAIPQIRSPFMASSLPSIASGLDQYQRQFYGSNSGIPQQRALQPQIENAAAQKLVVSKSAVLVASTDEINFIPGTNVSLQVVENSADQRVDVTINATASGSGSSSGTPALPLKSVQFNEAGHFAGDENQIWDPQDGLQVNSTAPEGIDFEGGENFGIQVGDVSPANQATYKTGIRVKALDAQFESVPVTGIQIDDQTNVNSATALGKLVAIIGDVHAELAIANRIEDAGSLTDGVYANKNGSYPLSGSTFTGPTLDINGQGSYLSGDRAAVVADTNGNFWVLLQGHIGTSPISCTKVAVSGFAVGQSYPEFATTDFSIAVATFNGDGQNSNYCARYCQGDDSLLVSAGGSIRKINCSNQTLSGLSFTPGAGTPYLTRIYNSQVLVFTADNLYLVNALTLGIVQTWNRTDFAIGSAFTAVCWDAANQVAWVQSSSNLYKLDLSNTTIITTIALGSSGWVIGLNSVSSAIICIQYGNTTIKSVDMDSYAVTNGTLPQGPMESLGIDIDGTIWTGSNFATDGWTESWAIDSGTLTVINTVGFNTLFGSGQNIVPRPRSYAFIQFGNTNAIALNADGGIVNLGPGPTYAEGGRLVTTASPAALTDNALIIGDAGNDIAALVSLGTAGQLLKSQGAGSPPVFADVIDPRGITIDGGASTPPLGSKGFFPIPYAGTIVAWTLIGNAAGDAQITIKKGTPSGDTNMPVMTSIVAAAPPNLSAQQRKRSTTLTGWTTSIAADDVLEYNLDSVTTCTRLTLVLAIKRS